MDVADKLDAINTKVMETGRNYIEEETGKMSSGKVQTFLAKKTPIFDKHKKVVGVLGVSIDITDQKLAKKLNGEKETAEKATLFMHKVAGSIAHELRTPLAIICLQIDLLRLDTNREKLEGCLDTIKSNVHSAAHVIGMILMRLKNLAENEINKEISNMIFDKCSVTKNINDALSEYPFQNNESGLITFENRNDFKYIGDDVLTKHILYNLIKNALWAIKTAGKGSIIIKIFENGKYNAVLFKDTALGIPPRVIEKLFGQYQSDDPTSQGTGLGLAFCKMVMKNYGGYIVCNSKQGEGAEFILFFPKI